MNRSLRSTLATLAGGLVLHGAAGAHSTPITEVAVPAPRVIHGITVVDGGASSDEAQAMRRLSTQYPLRVVLSAPNGEYQVADRLSVWRGGHLVTEVDNAGPWVLMDLPPGPYTLQSRIDGQLMQRPLTLSASGTTLHWVMPSARD